MHPNIVRLFELLPVQRYVGLVMEYVPEGDLFEYVIQNGRPGLSEASALGIFQQIIRAVDYMHRQGVVSRDIKLENCLLTRDDPPRVKLCDFGFSKSDAESMPNSRVGTPQYIPPELLQQPTYDGKKADVWCCGVLLYSMLAGSFPFYRSDDSGLRGEMERRNAVLHRIVRCEYTLPRGLSPECCNLIANLLVRDPQRRLSVADIQRHAYFVRGLSREWFAESASLRAAATPGEGLSKGQVEDAFRIASGGGSDGAQDDDIGAEHDELDAFDD
jgi:serine/threonine-protein kinase SRK2